MYVRNFSRSPDVIGLAVKHITAIQTTMFSNLHTSDTCKMIHAVIFLNCKKSLRDIFFYHGIYVRKNHAFDRSNQLIRNLKILRRRLESFQSRPNAVCNVALLKIYILSTSVIAVLKIPILPTCITNSNYNSVEIPAISTSLYQSFR